MQDAGFQRMLSFDMTGRCRGRNPVVRWIAVGVKVGCALGVIGGLIVDVATVHSLGFTGYAVSLVLWASVAAAILGAGVGLIVGALNGVILNALAKTEIYRSVKPVRAIASMFITGTSSFLILSAIFAGMSGLFVYPPTLAGAAAALWLSGRLPQAVTD